MLETAATKWPDKPAVSFEGKTQSWLETFNRSRAAATLLKASGVQKGDCVAYLGFNSNVCFESYYSPALIGAILVPLNYRLSLREMIECVEDSTARILIVDSHFVEQAQEIQQSCARIQAIVYAGSNTLPENMISYEQLLAELIATNAYCEISPGQDDDTVLIFYTGGTTGRSKGVVLSNKNLQSNTDCSIPLYRMQEGWNFIVLGPLFHLAAGARVFTCTVLGGHSVILPKFDVAAVLETIQNYKINSVTLVPTMLQMILDDPAFTSYDLSSLNMLAYGAAPMSFSLISRVIQAFPGAEIFQTYGMTEASPILTCLDSQYHVLDSGNSKLGSVGKAASHVELKIVDDKGDELPAGETGEIIARGENIMQGYWRLPEQTAEALKDGWYHTGDAGYLDTEDFLFLEGRVKDMIVSGGENIYPIEVENILSNHAAVNQCAVIGIPDEIWGEAVHAVVVLKENQQANETELIAFCKQYIASYKCPVSVTLRDQPMPLSPINKILKTELRKAFWRGRENKLV